MEVYSNAPTSKKKKKEKHQIDFTPKTTGKRRTETPPKLVEGKK